MATTLGVKPVLVVLFSITGVTWDWGGLFSLSSTNNMLQDESRSEFSSSSQTGEETIAFREERYVFARTAAMTQCTNSNISRYFCRAVIRSDWFKTNVTSCKHTWSVINEWHRCLACNSSCKHGGGRKRTAILSLLLFCQENSSCSLLLQFLQWKTCELPNPNIPLRIWEEFGSLQCSQCSTKEGDNPFQ